MPKGNSKKLSNAQLDLLSSMYEKAASNTQDPTSYENRIQATKDYVYNKNNQPANALKFRRDMIYIQNK